MDGGNFVNQSINHVPKITQQTYKREVELESPVHVLKIAAATVIWYIIQNFFQLQIKSSLDFCVCMILISLNTIQKSLTLFLSLSVSSLFSLHPHFVPKIFLEQSKSGGR